jgi:hypothetical protein
MTEGTAAWNTKKIMLCLADDFNIYLRHTSPKRERRGKSAFPSLALRVGVRIVAASSLTLRVGMLIESVRRPRAIYTHNMQLPFAALGPISSRSLNANAVGSVGTASGIEPIRCLA